MKQQSYIVAQANKPRHW